MPMPCTHCRAMPLAGQQASQARPGEDTLRLAPDEQSGRAVAPTTFVVGPVPLAPRATPQSRSFFRSQNPLFSDYSSTSVGYSITEMLSGGR